jgi:hypothetical protein
VRQLALKPAIVGQSFGDDVVGGGMSADDPELPVWRPARPDCGGPYLFEYLA